VLTILRSNHTRILFNSFYFLGISVSMPSSHTWRYYGQETMHALQDPVLPIAEESQAKILLKSKMPEGQKAGLAEEEDARG
jgi:hypothetical protein